MRLLSEDPDAGNDGGRGPVDARQIKQYWDERAMRYGSSSAATTDDIHLRDLEISALTKVMKALPTEKRRTVLDVGCGDGWSTLALAANISDSRFVGIDYSQSMVELASRRLASSPEFGGRVSFMVGDVLDLKRDLGSELFNVVLTDRCLINLSSAEDQAQAIRQIALSLHDHGLLVSIENFVEGQRNLNAARGAMGVPPIPVRWHNLYLSEPGIRAMAAPYFDRIVFNEFASAYYFATRVLYAAVCKSRGEEPDYDHDIHKLAPKLPPTGKFSPVRMFKLRRQGRHPRVSSELET